MQRLTAQSVTPAVRAWLSQTRHARILHVFDHAVNLITGDDVLSLVGPEIGNGPFNVVLPSSAFTRQIALSDPLHITPDALQIGDLVIDLSSASLWNPHPDWTYLRAQQTRLQAQVPVIRSVLQYHAPANSLAHLLVKLPVPRSNLETRVLNTARQHWCDIIQGALMQDQAACRAGVKQFVGLGSGLTPAGDDWLLGCALAAHFDLPSPSVATLILQTIRWAAGDTHPLSACWLRAAVDGACSTHWHAFFASCMQADSQAVSQTAVRIVHQGHSSGADALAGMLALLVLADSR